MSIISYFLFSTHCVLWVFWGLTECGKVYKVGGSYEARRSVEKCQG